LRKNLSSFTYEISYVWLIDNVIANQRVEQCKQERGKVKKRAAIAGGPRGLQGGVKQSGQEPLSVQEAGHAPVMNPKA
jgi:hypothetical protein